MQPTRRSRDVLVHRAARPGPGVAIGTVYGGMLFLIGFVTSIDLHQRMRGRLIGAILGGAAYGALMGGCSTNQISHLFAASGEDLSSDERVVAAP